MDRTFPDFSERFVSRNDSGNFQTIAKPNGFTISTYEDGNHMRQGSAQNRQRSRNRGHGNRGNHNRNNLNRSLESNGPDVRIRGTAAHIAEKYQQLARDAQSAGDGIAAESYWQHAEHYNRLIAAVHAAQPQPRQDASAQDASARSASEPPENGQAAKPAEAGAEADEEEAPSRTRRPRTRAGARASQKEAEASGAEDPNDGVEIRRPGQVAQKNKDKSEDANEDNDGVERKSELPDFLSKSSQE